MKFRKKPVVIEAVQYTGFNVAECLTFGGGSVATKAGCAGVFVHTLEGTCESLMGTGSSEA